MSNITSLSGYSKRFKKYRGGSYTKDTNQYSPKAGIKLDPITPGQLKITSPSDIYSSPMSNTKIPRSTLTKVIEANSSDYESAIRQHLGIKTISRESNPEEYSPLTKIYTNSPKYQPYVKVLDNTLENVESKESEIQSVIRSLDNKNIQSKIRPIHNSDIPNFALNEKKLMNLRGSIEDMRVLLKKIKK